MLHKIFYDSTLNGRSTAATSYIPVTAKFIKFHENRTLISKVVVG